MDAKEITVQKVKEAIPEKKKREIWFSEYQDGVIDGRNQVIDEIRKKLKLEEKI